MAIQTIEPSGSDWGTSLGSTLGSGLSGALQGLAESKLQQIQKQHEYKSNYSGLQALGIPNAEQLAHLDSASLQQIIKHNLEAPSRQAYAQSLQGLLGGEQQQPQQQGIAPQAQQTQSPLQNINPAQRQRLEQYLNSPAAQKSGNSEQILKLKKALAMPFEQPTQPQAIPGQNTQEQLPVIQGGLNERQATELAKLGLQKQKMTAADKRHEKQLEHDLKKEALKETKEIRKDLFAKKKSAQDTIEAINRFEELEKEGLPSAGWSDLLKNAGLDIPSLLGASGEEYNKVAANFVRNAKAVFGSRLTDTDLNQFLKTVPSLSNSPEGRKRINANLKRVANLDKYAVDAYEDILKDNKGIPPLDLDLKLDKALDQKREAVYKQFKKDLEKEVPATQNTAATLLQSGIGTLIGGAKKALPTAIGYAVGGPVGAGLGAASSLLYNLFGSK